MKRSAIMVLLTAGFVLASGPRDVEESLTRPVIEFREVFRLDNSKGDDETIWSGAFTAVDVDARGHMFITDGGANRILEFDPEGTFVRQHGNRGNGPGEFQKLCDFRAIPGGGYYAFENTQNNAYIHLFDENMKFVRRIPGFTRGRVLQSSVVGPDGAYIAATWMDGGKGADAAVHSGILPLEGNEPLLLLSSSPRPIFENHKAHDPAWFISFIAGWLDIAAAGVGLAVFDRSGNLYTATTNAYEISYFNRDLKYVRTIAHEVRPEVMSESDRDAMVEPFHEQLLDIMPPPLHPMITRSVMERAIEQADFPVAKQPIFGLLPMDNGHLLVVRDYKAKAGVVPADLFDAAGSYLGPADLPPIDVNVFSGFFGIHTRMAFHDGHAYATVRDEEGEIALIRYRYTID